MPLKAKVQRPKLSTVNIVSKWFVVASHMFQPIACLISIIKKLQSESVTRFPLEIYKTNASAIQVLEYVIPPALPKPKIQTVLSLTLPSISERKASLILAMPAF